MKTFMMLLLTVATFQVNDNYVDADKSVMVYYSPKNSVRLDFVYTEKTQEAGEFAAYAEELLGITDAIKESKTTYTFQRVEIGSSTQVDLQRPHAVNAEYGMPWQSININQRGLLIGYNLPPQEKPATQPKNFNNADKSKTCTMKILPYTEEIVNAKTKAAKADAVAKQIFHIRETRSYLLNGEVEHAPADGEAMKLVLNELNRQEKQLMELFVGKTTVKTLHKHVTNCPYGENYKVWDESLYFSEENGFTGADNIDAEHIRIYVEFQHQLKKEASVEVAPKGKKDKNTIEYSPIVYNQPGYARVLIYRQETIIGERVLPMAQFGIDMPLPKDLFTGTTLPVIVFDEKTGNIKSISK
jgi:hypothetical protein